MFFPLLMFVDFNISSIILLNNRTVPTPPWHFISVPGALFVPVHLEEDALSLF